MDEHGKFVTVPAKKNENLARTPVMSLTSKIWHDAASTLSNKLIFHANSVLDAGMSERMFDLARELRSIGEVLKQIPNVNPELGAKFRGPCIDRIIAIYADVKPFLGNVSEMPEF